MCIDNSAGSRLITGGYSFDRMIVILVLYFKKVYGQFDPFISIRVWPESDGWLLFSSFCNVDRSSDTFFQFYSSENYDYHLKNYLWIFIDQNEGFYPFEPVHSI